MKRFTKRELLEKQNLAYVSGDDCFDTWSVPKKFMGNAIERLAEYEDTELEPQEINRIVDAYGRGYTLRTYDAERLQIIKDIPTDRLRDLVEAHRKYLREAKK